MTPKSVVRMHMLAPLDPTAPDAEKKLVERMKLEEHASQVVRADSRPVLADSRIHREPCTSIRGHSRPFTGQPQVVAGISRACRICRAYRTCRYFKVK